MGVEEQLKSKLEDLGQSVEDVTTDTFDPRGTSPLEDLEAEADFETIEQKKVITHHPAEFEVEDTVHTAHLKTGGQYKLILKHRPECPTCDHVVLNLDEESPPARCNQENCSRWTCPQCWGICEACDDTLCPEHSYGHGQKDQPYCLDCVGDIEEQVRHEREMDRRKQERQDRAEARQLRQLKGQERKDQAELKLRVYQAKQHEQQSHSKSDASDPSYQDQKDQLRKQKQKFSKKLDNEREKFTQ